MTIYHADTVSAFRRTVIEGEFADRVRLISVFRDYEIEAVMHFAAFALVNESVNHPAIYYQNNVTPPRWNCWKPCVRRACGALSLLEYHGHLRPA